MATRLKYFDGLFLRHEEFELEQLYHMDMRRHVNYMLFESGGVVETSINDLAIQVTDVTNQKFIIKAGMGISINADQKKGTEIVLASDSAEINLGALGITTPTAFIKLNYIEQNFKDPVTVSQDSRTLETSQIEAVETHPGAPTGTDNYIILGSITLASMAVDSSSREIAKVRSALMATSPMPTIASFGLSSVQPGTTHNGVIITGTNLSGASLAFSNAGLSVNVTATSTLSITFDLTVSATVPVGTYSFTVTTSAGSVNSMASGISLTVATAPGPTLTSMTVAPASANLSVGGAVTLTATGTFSDASVRVLTAADGLAWTSTNNAIALPNSAGVVTGVAEGNATITATAGTKTATAVITVVQTPVIVEMRNNAGGSGGGGSVEIRGTNIRGATETSGSVPSGVSIEFVDPTDSTKRLFGTNLEVRPDVVVGTITCQVIRFKAPARGTTLSAGAVNVQITRNGAFDIELNGYVYTS